MKRRHPLFVVAAVLAVLVIGPTATARPAAPSSSGTIVLQGNVLRSIAHLQALGSTATDRQIGVGIGLEGNDPAGRAAYIAGEYDPTSPLFGQYLAPDEYEQRFGVPAARVDATMQWLRDGGLTPQTIDGTSDYVIGSGTVAQVQRLLNVQIKDFQAGALSFYANTADPTVPADLGVIGIVGLNSLEGPRLNSQSAPRSAATPATPDPAMNINNTSPSDLWSIYNQPAENKGDGQSMAIFGWGTTKNTEADLRGFEREFKLPAVPLTIKYFGTETAVTDSGGEVEWNIDTQASTGMAPNAKNETMYMAKAGTDADLLAAYNAWAADARGALQGSSSFGGCEEAPGTDSLNGGPGSPSGVIIAGQPNQDLYEKVLSKLVAEGRTMFASTGDTGAGCPAISAVLNGVTLVPTPMLNYPAVSPNAVGVGGTVLYFNDASTGAPVTPASRALEYGWTHGGGGFSEFVAAPAYQKTNPPILTPCITDPHGNPYPGGVPPTCRGIPDVSAQSGDVASNGYNITAGGVNDSSGGGTSLSSPLWLGMWTRIQAASTKPSGNGFANPAIYGVANDPAKYAKDFFDVGGVSTDTIVSCNGVTPLNCSHPGWDYLTGWGTPNITNLMLDLDGRTKPREMTKLRPLPPVPADTHGGTTCPGPQVIDAVGDAPNNYPGGDGSNMDNLDIQKVVFASPDASTLRMTMTLKDLQPPGPPVAELSALWTVYWSYGNTAYSATATVNGAVWKFSDSAGNDITGVAVMGPNGTITMDVPLADTGNPAPGAKVTETFADSRGSLTVQGTGLRYTAAADRAPDSGNGAPWTIGKVC